LFSTTVQKILKAFVVNQSSLVLGHGLFSSPHSKGIGRLLDYTLTLTCFAGTVYTLDVTRKDKYMLAPMPGHMCVRDQNTDTP
jgi:hypothetical protein